MIIKFKRFMSDLRKILFCPRPSKVFKEEINKYYNTNKGAKNGRIKI